MLESEVEKYGGIKLNETEHLTHEARFAVELVVRWGGVAATPDGEDSSGRSKLRLQTEAELIDRAVKTAALLMDKLRTEGFIHVSPTLEEIESIKETIKKF